MEQEIPGQKEGDRMTDVATDETTSTTNYGCYSGCPICNGKEFTTVREAINAITTVTDNNNIAINKLIGHLKMVLQNNGGGNQAGEDLVLLLRCAWRCRRWPSGGNQTGGNSELPPEKIRIVCGVDFAANPEHQALTILLVTLQHPKNDAHIYWVDTINGPQVFKLLLCRRFLDLFDVIGIDAPVGVPLMLPNLLDTYTNVVIHRDEITRNVAESEKDEYQAQANNGTADVTSTYRTRIVKNADYIRNFLIPNTQDENAQVEARSALLMRYTEQVVATFGGSPLASFADKIARMVLLNYGLQAHWTWLYAIAAKEPDKDYMLKRIQGLRLNGEGWLVEVYPAMSRLQWGIGLVKKNQAQNNQTQKFEATKSCDGYHKMFTPYPNVICAICQVLISFDVKSFSCSTKRGSCSQSDRLDSVIAALTAIAAKVGMTLKPRKRDDLPALVEGWIHFPITAKMATQQRDGHREPGSFVACNKALHERKARWEGNQNNGDNNSESHGRTSHTDNSQECLGKVGTNGMKGELLSAIAKALRQNNTDQNNSEQNNSDQNNTKQDNTEWPVLRRRVSQATDQADGQQ